MPIVRLSRDKRGLDTVYLIDTGSGPRARTRVLYFWTAPPGLRVGLDAFDEARRRAIERAHPDVSFDWPELSRVLEQARQQAPVPGLETKRDAWRAGRPTRGRPRAADREDEPTAAPTAASAQEPPPTPASGAEATSEEPASPTSRQRRRRRRGRRAGTSDEPAPNNTDL